MGHNVFCRTPALNANFCLLKEIIPFAKRDQVKQSWVTSKSIKMTLSSSSLLEGHQSKFSDMATVTKMENCVLKVEPSAFDQTTTTQKSDIRKLLQ